MIPYDYPYYFVNHQDNASDDVVKYGGTSTQLILRYYITTTISYVKCIRIKPNKDSGHEADGKNH